MKMLTGTFLAACLMAGTAFAEFETWTNRDGNTARMKLIEVTRENDQVVAKFQLENGRTANINAEALSEADAARVLAWQPEKIIESIFDDMLDFARNLKMPWPHVRFQRVEQIRKRLAHPVPGFPTFMVCDLNGNVLHRFHGLAPLKNILLN